MIHVCYILLDLWIFSLGIFFGFFTAKYNASIHEYGKGYDTGYDTGYIKGVRDTLGSSEKMEETKEAE